MVELPLEYEVDPTQYMDINYTWLAEMLEWTDKLFEDYHIALNMSTDTIFMDTGNFDKIQSFYLSDNLALQGGFAIAAYSFK